MQCVDLISISKLAKEKNIPVIVDAGIGAPSHAAHAMEMGADAVLVNSAIALAQDAPVMAKAMSKAVQAGRLAFLAGRLPQRSHAIPSSPTFGIITNSTTVQEK